MSGGPRGSPCPSRAAGPAIPASAAFFASLSEFDLWSLIAAAIRWRRHEGRHVPGAGAAAHGYLLLADDGDGESDGRGSPAELDPGMLWR